MFDEAHWNSISQQLISLLVALAAGAAIGFEREWRDRTAGLRTHILVAVGAATYMMVSDQIIQAYASGESSVRMDPLRTAAGLVGGIGFLGAGAIVQGGGSVRGLTTAASIWMTAALGMAAGVEAYQTLVLAALVVLVVLIPLRLLEKTMQAHRHHRDRRAPAAPGGEEPSSLDGS